MDKFNYLKEQLTAALATWQQTNGGKTTVGWMHAANPEVIAAMLAELEAKDKRIAELEQLPTIKHMRSVEESLIRATDMVSELEAKLATPVRLQSPWVDKVGNRWLLEGTTADVIRAAGFAVTVEGDE